MNFICSACRQPKQRIRTARKNPANRSWVYVDEHNRVWRQAHCPECKRADDVMRGRRNGRKSIDDCTAKHLIKGREAEHFAAWWLKEIGYIDLRLGNSKGPDIIARRPANKFETFEVKSVVKQSVSDGLFVHAIAPTRRKDDYVICVHEGDCIMFAMKEHLKECWKHGARNVTNLFRVAGVKHYEVKIKAAK
jgi:hypothetical protein